MSTPQFNFIIIVKVYHMELLLLLMIVFWRIHLECFDDDIILLRFYNFKDLMNLILVSELIFKLFFTQLTMKCLPSVWSYKGANLLVFISAKPLPQTLKVNKLHWTRTLTRGDEWIIFISIIREADSAHIIIAWISFTFRIIILPFGNDHIFFYLFLFFATISDTEAKKGFDRRSIMITVSTFFIGIEFNLRTDIYDLCVRELTCLLFFLSAFIFG